MLTACAPQADRSTSTVPSPPLGFGEPLSPGSYVFFADYPDDWPDTILQVRYIAGALPKLRWRMCDVRSPASRRTETDRARARTDLSNRLESVRVVPRIETGPAPCRTEPRDLDMFYLMPLSDD